MKVALVTGAGKRRVGSHVADAFADKGYGIAIHYRTSESEASDAVAGYIGRGLHAIAVQADLSDERAIHGMIDQVLAHFGRLDVLVNAAADWKPKRFENITAADLRHYFDVNTLGTFLCSQLAGLAMVKQPTGGCIVNIGDWAIARPYLNYAAYFPSKGAIPTLTRVLAVELGTRNPAVRVNCVHPGPVMLPPDMPQAEKDAVIAATLVKREGSPDDVARAVMFLVESDFVTGTCVTVDGGRTVFAGE